MLVIQISIMTKTFLKLISLQIRFAQVKSVPYLPILLRCQGVRAVDVKFWTSRWPAFRWAAFLIDGNEGTCTGRRDVICVISRVLALGHINIATFFWSFNSLNVRLFTDYEKNRCWYADVVCFCRIFLGRALEYHCYHTNWFALCPTHGTTAWWILRWHTTYGGWYDAISLFFSSSSKNSRRNRSATLQVPSAELKTRRDSVHRPFFCRRFTTRQRLLSAAHRCSIEYSWWCTTHFCKVKKNICFYFFPSFSCAE